MSYKDNTEINLFREYLRIPSVHPNVNYEPCVTFLRRLANELHLTFAVYHPAHPKKPVVAMSWVGSSPTLPSILLNSHMDVVPVFSEYWTHKPFDAEMDDDGKIFARGAQDMKCVGMQYLSAIKRLKDRRIVLRRTVHVLFVPDEEIGGEDGMKKFVTTDEFRSLNVGFSLDEGLASPTEEFPVYYAERSVWRIHFKCPGTPGHGSLLHKNTAGEKIRVIIDRMMDFREQEVRKLDNNPDLTIGDVTTVNLTMISGGIQTNVVPPLLIVGFDVRLAITQSHDEFEALVNRWCEEAGGDIDIFYESKKPKVEPTKMDNENPFWVAFKHCICDELNLKINPLIFPGRTDSCFIRGMGIPALGFSPMNNTPVLLHDHDEFISADTYLKGIDIYEKLIPSVANCIGMDNTINP
ncbi:aminoacylase-1-like isoform X1 [Bradysia coprophila]|uniref:aminoacylase-1-like isoform X1 n=2 Tax=Bradysia coprophila TaxID=38358 RepID=UPI00187D7A28|nr:aminoacylase-1-like isoform X1 [Bradysia coprophila]